MIIRQTGREMKTTAFQTSNSFQHTIIVTENFPLGSFVGFIEMLPDNSNQFDLNNFFCNLFILHMNKPSRTVPPHVNITCTRVYWANQPSQQLKQKRKGAKHLVSCAQLLCQ